uniref:S-norcoclaurine synthase 1 n=1 Tax=Aegilops tauschii TaxID=37682 RepID=N1QT96_AEGTA
MEVEALDGSDGDSRWSKLGTTLPVRNVQALAAVAAGELTGDAIERYIQPDIDADAVIPTHSDEVPVIDLGKLTGAESMEAETAKLRFACEEWGFFQVVSLKSPDAVCCLPGGSETIFLRRSTFIFLLRENLYTSAKLVNHGVPDEIILAIRRDIEKFFQLPLDVKNAYAQRQGDLQGYGQAFILSHDQKLDWADMFGLYTQPPQARDMSFWPSQPPMFRMNYYPPCTSMPEKVLGLSPHSDGSFLTILLEVNSVQGLQIRRRGAWLPVKPLANALLLNVGDLLEIMTNGKYKSIEHRVTINAHQERLSISAFHVPKYDGIVSPLLGTTEEKVLYKTTKVEEYSRLYLSKKLHGKRTLDHAKLSQT